MISFKTFYTEAKQVGILYHFTKISQLPKILNTNTIGRNTNGRVSLTRDKYFMKHQRIGIGTKDACLVIDGDKLSTKYKIEPYNYFGGEEPGSNEIPFDNYEHTSHKDTYDEQEERTLKPINNIKNYIIKIKLLKRSLDAYEDNIGAFSFAINHEKCYHPYKDIFKTFRSANQYIKFLEQFCPVEVVEKL